MATKPRRVAQSLTNKIYLLLRNEILSCRIRPGAELSEGTLAERYNTSKTPVREALSKLRAEGLVQSFPRRGYQVAHVTFQDMNELFEVRNMLEGRAAELASQNISEGDAKKLAELANILYDSSEHVSVENFVQANRSFHEGIARASGNNRLFHMVIQVLDELQRFFVIGAQNRDISDETKDLHIQIVDALKAHDPVEARRIMILHNTITQRGLLSALTESQNSSIHFMPVLDPVG